jgi:hypothetical protein
MLVLFERVARVAQAILIAVKGRVTTGVLCCSLDVWAKNVARQFKVVSMVRHTVPKRRPSSKVGSVIRYPRATLATLSLFPTHSR